MELDTEEIKKKIKENSFNTFRELEEYCNLIYEEMKKLRLDFKNNTLNDKKLSEYFKEDNPRDRFSSILVAGTILGGIELRNNWRDNSKLEGEKEEFPYNEKQIEMIDRYNELQDILDQVEWYAETTVFEDEEELE